MARRRDRNRSSRVHVAADLELLPLMNIFIVLIPMLLLSAVFVEVRAIEMAAPRVSEAADAASREPLDLAIGVSDAGWVVQGHGIPEARIPRPADGSLVPLIEVLRGVTARYPLETSVRIVAQPGTRYEELVSLMDAARTAGLPDASLMGGAQGGS